MGFLSVSISRVEMSLLRKCLQEMSLPLKSHNEENTVLSFFRLVPFNAGGCGGKPDTLSRISSLWFTRVGLTCRKYVPDTKGIVLQPRPRV